MTTSPLLGFDEMAVDQANKYLTFNEAVKLLEAFATGRVISATTAAEPGSPSDGDLYILPASPTGTGWATFSQGDLALRRGTEWFNVSPLEGFRFWVEDEDVEVIYDGTDWVENPVLIGDRSSDPDDPPEGAFTIWQSDGTDSGDDGDIMIKITAGATTKTATLIDFSAV